MRTLYQVVADSAARFPERPAIIYQDRRISYRELLERVDRLAAGLVALGVQPGDKVAIWMSNVPEWIEAYFAISRAGGWWCP